MGDLISRQAAIDEIGKAADELYENIKKGATFPQRQWFDGMAHAQSILEDLPPAQPEPKEGNWIPHEGIDGDIQYECSRCGVLWEFNYGTPEDNEAFYCPKCGSYLGGGQK